MKAKSRTALRIGGVIASVVLLGLAAYRLIASGYYLDEMMLGPTSPYNELLWAGLFLALASVPVMAALAGTRRRAWAVAGSLVLAASLALQTVIALMTP